MGELVNIRHGAHEGFERLVFEFSGEERPNFFSVKWRDDPRTGMTQDPIDVEGEGFLKLEVLGLYPGPLEESPAGDERIEFQGEPFLIEESTLFTEVHRAHRYQYSAPYVIGLDTEREIWVEQKGDPSRIIIDVANQRTADRWLIPNWVTGSLHLIYNEIMTSADTTTVRVRRPDVERLRSLAKSRQTGVIDVLHAAIDALERQEFLRGLGQDYQRLREDPERWEQYLAERQEWDSLA